MGKDYRNSNIISVHIYNGTTIVAKSDAFKNILAAKLSAERIIKNQKNIDPSTTAYAVVWKGRQMVEYID